MSSLQANPDGRGSGILLPLAVPSEAAEDARRPVCIVDDDASVRDSLSTLLETLGFTVHVYGSGREFLADGRRRDAGCLIVDQHMPGIDGLQTLAALRGSNPELPAILITGRCDPGIAARARALGVTAILEKPFRMAELVETVRAGLRRRSCPRKQTGCGSGI